MATVISDDTAAGRNVLRAVDFLMKMGYIDEAINIDVWLTKGKILTDRLGVNGETDRFSKDITIDTTSIQGPGQNKDFDSTTDLGWESIVNLARILFHEKVHAHQNYFWLVAQFWETALWNGMTGDQLTGGDEEIEAWEKTLLAMNNWIQTIRGLPQY